MQVTELVTPYLTVETTFIKEEKEDERKKLPRNVVSKVKSKEK